MSLVQWAISFLLFAHGTSKEVRATCVVELFIIDLFLGLCISAAFSWFAWHHQLRVILWRS